MATVWDLLSKSSYHSDDKAIKILEYLKANNHSHLNCEEFFSALFKDGTNDCWRRYLFPNSPVDNLPLQSSTIRIAGSWSEGVNLGQDYVYAGLITELDFMLTFGTAGKYGGPLILEATSDRGYYLVRIRSSLLASQEFLNNLCTKRGSNFYLSPAKSVAHMENVVSQSFIKL